MEKTVAEVSRLTGISVRTLHYYDEIKLLCPSRITDAGYRLYGKAALERLQQILFFRELDFPLKEIQEILDSPSFDRGTALERHKELLSLKRSRLDHLINLVDGILKGESEMSFTEFDQSAEKALRKKYATEARERWGGTSAYEESETKTKGYTKEDWDQIQGEAAEIYSGFASKKALEPESPEVQVLVKAWQDHITNHYYQCTDEILAGLGEMYCADDRFRKSIDSHGQGLAEFMSKAIAAYCGG